MSESRNSNERMEYGYTSYSSESHDSGESRCESRKQVSVFNFNNLKGIDSYIEKLEKEKPSIQSDSPRINQAIAQRKQKIEELKRLRDEAARALEEEKQLMILEYSNAELDEAISQVKKLVKKQTNKPIKNNSSFTGYGYDNFGYSSESHDSGESRW